jgi:hypothetical protein
MGQCHLCRLLEAAADPWCVVPHDPWGVGNLDRFLHRLGCHNGDLAGVLGCQSCGRKGKSRQGASWRAVINGPGVDLAEGCREVLL